MKKIIGLLTFLLMLIVPSLSYAGLFSDLSDFSRKVYQSGYLYEGTFNTFDQCESRKKYKESTSSDGRSDCFQLELNSKFYYFICRNSSTCNKTNILNSIGYNEIKDKSTIVEESNLVGGNCGTTIDTTKYSKISLSTKQKIFSLGDKLQGKYSKENETIQSIELGYFDYRMDDVIEKIKNDKSKEKLLDVVLLFKDIFVCKMNELDKVTFEKSSGNDVDDFIGGLFGEDEDSDVVDYSLVTKRYIENRMSESKSFTVYMNAYTGFSEITKELVGDYVDLNDEETSNGLESVAGSTLDGNEENIGSIGDGNDDSAFEIVEYNKESLISKLGGLPAADNMTVNNYCIKEGYIGLDSYTKGNTGDDRYEIYVGGKVSKYSTNCNGFECAISIDCKKEIEIKNDDNKQLKTFNQPKYKGEILWIGRTSYGLQWCKDNYNKDSDFVYLSTGSYNRDKPFYYYTIDDGYVYSEGSGMGGAISNIVCGVGYSEEEGKELYKFYNDNRFVSIGSFDIKKIQEKLSGGLLHSSDDQAKNFCKDNGYEDVQYYTEANGDYPKYYMYSGGEVELHESDCNDFKCITSITCGKSKTYMDSTKDMNFVGTLYWDIRDNVGVSYEDAKSQCEKDGKRLPTIEEINKNINIFGDDLIKKLNLKEKEGFLYLENNTWDWAGIGTDKGRRALYWVEGGKWRFETTGGEVRTYDGSQYENTNKKFVRRCVKNIDDREELYDNIFKGYDASEYEEVENVEELKNVEEEKYSYSELNSKVQNCKTLIKGESIIHSGITTSSSISNQYRLIKSEKSEEVEGGIKYFYKNFSCYTSTNIVKSNNDYIIKPKEIGLKDVIECNSGYILSGNKCLKLSGIPVMDLGVYNKESCTGKNLNDGKCIANYEKILLHCNENNNGQFIYKGPLIITIGRIKGPSWSYLRAGREACNKQYSGGKYATIAGYRDVKIANLGDKDYYPNGDDPTIIKEIGFRLSNMVTSSGTKYILQYKCLEDGKCYKWDGEVHPDVKRIIGTNNIQVESSDGTLVVLKPNTNGTVKWIRGGGATATVANLGGASYVDNKNWKWEKGSSGTYNCISWSRANDTKNIVSDSNCFGNKPAPVKYYNAWCKDGKITSNGGNAILQSLNGCGYGTTTYKNGESANGYYCISNITNYGSELCPQSNFGGSGVGCSACPNGVYNGDTEGKFCSVASGYTGNFYHPTEKEWMNDGRAKCYHGATNQNVSFKIIKK